MLAEEPPLPREDGAKQQVRRFYLVRPVVSCQRFAWAWDKRCGTKWRVGGMAQCFINIDTKVGSVLGRDTLFEFHEAVKCIRRQMLTAQKRMGSVCQVPTPRI